VIHELLQPRFLKSRTADLAENLQSHADAFDQAPPDIRKKAETEGITAQDIRQAQAILAQQADHGDFSVRPEDAAWLPRDPYLSIVQSAFEQFYIDKDAVATSARAGFGGEADPVTDEALKPEWKPTDSRPFMRQTETSDIFRWGLTFAAAKAVAGLHRKPKFEVAKETARLEEKARIVLMGDWASGVRRAQSVGKQIEKQLDDPEAAAWDRHVIHLGDVYYAGFGREYRKHLGKYWPVADANATQVGSWCLNGNHDMFTGGAGLFEYLRKDTRFARQKGCTWFTLESPHWLIFALDTAYESEGLKGDKGGLAAPQATWIMEQMARAPEKKVIFLSHHQPFSAWEGDSPRLMDALHPLLHGKRPITAWFWGHEHRCAVYQPAHNIHYPALIGHGGVPVYASSKQPRGVEVRDYDRRSFRRFGEKFSYMGFAVLDLDGPHATVRYIDENGDPPGDKPWEPHVVA
jgi:hypothetical protein